MDAREDSVWPRATSELILLPVTGLECVGDRLLAGEACLEARAGGRGAERRRGGTVRTKRVAGAGRRWVFLRELQRAQTRAGGVA